MSRERSVHDQGLDGSDLRHVGRGDLRDGLSHLSARHFSSGGARSSSHTRRLVTLTIAGAAVLAALAARPLYDVARAQRRAVGADTPSASPSAPVASSTCAEHVQVRLFFGLVTPTGRVSDAEWAGFLADTITPRFPRGLTVVHADGQWRAPGRTTVMREPSQVVEIVDHGGEDMDQRVREIVEIYRRRFRQDSVLLTRGRVEACY